ncbi:MAG: acyl-CoA dehydrogenase, partial [Actinobacteria bacterium]|nr:acyl-CoA dehydrogenase [Actinomycetota bacterium]
MTTVWADDPTLGEVEAAVAAICRDFPDEYWRARDDAHEFPWAFYNAMAEA